MKTKIKATKIQLNGEIESYLDKKLSAVEKIAGPSDPLLLAEVELGRTTKHHQTGNIFRAEINLRTSKGVFRAEAEEKDLNTAIDSVRDEILKILKASKGKKVAMARKDLKKIKTSVKSL